MKRISMLIAVMALAVPCFGQVVEQGTNGGELQKFEFTFNPYSYVQLDSVGLHGAGGGVAFHLNKTVAIVADFSLNKAGDEINQEVFSFRGGPRFTRRSGKASVFGHILVGGMHYRNDVDTTVHGLAGGAGGGIDIGANSWLTFRVIQGEYFPVYFTDVGNIFHGVKFTTGFVFHLR